MTPRIPAPRPVTSLSLALVMTTIATAACQSAPAARSPETRSRTAVTRLAPGEPETSTAEFVAMSRSTSSTFSGSLFVPAKNASCPGVLNSTHIAGLPTESGYRMVFTSGSGVEPLRVRVRNVVEAYEERPVLATKPQYETVQDGAAINFVFPAAKRNQGRARLEKDLRQLQAGKCPAHLRPSKTTKTALHKTP